jgi:hypothetical protein
MKRMKIAVKRNNIASAILKDSHHCMIADAIQEQVPWAKFVSVDTQSIRMSNAEEGRRYIFLTPPLAQQAIIKFDQGVMVQPFQIELRNPQVRHMRVRCPGYDPSTRDKTKEKKTTRYMPSQEREFGLRKITGRRFTVKVDDGKA